MELDGVGVDTRRAVDLVNVVELGADDASPVASALDAVAVAAVEVAVLDRDPCRDVRFTVGGLVSAVALLNETAMGYGLPTGDPSSSHTLPDHTVCAGMLAAGP
jgi:hypothetical protein